MPSWTPAWFREYLICKRWYGRRLCRHLLSLFRWLEKIVNIWSPTSWSFGERMCSHLGGTLVVYQKPQDTPLRDAQRGFRNAANGSWESASVLANPRRFQRLSLRISHPFSKTLLPNAAGSPGKNPPTGACVQGLCTLLEDKEAQALLGILNNRILMGTEPPHWAGLLGMALKL